MRTTRLYLAVAVVAVIGVAAIPTTASAANSSALSAFEKKQNKKIKKALKKANKALDKIANLEDDLASQNTAQNNANASQDEKIAGLESTVNTIVAGVPDIINGLTALEDGLTTVGAGLTAINAALQNPTTGLVGLNSARPQFGFFAGDGAFLGGTGQVANGPNDPAVRLGAGTYVINFRNDISKRAYSVTPFPTGGAPLVASAINCAVGSQAAPGSGIDNGCDAAAGSTGDHPERVFVVLQNSVSGAPADGSFQVLAISG